MNQEALYILIGDRKYDSVQSSRAEGCLTRFIPNMIKSKRLTSSDVSRLVYFPHLTSLLLRSKEILASHETQLVNDLFPIAVRLR